MADTVEMDLEVLSHELDSYLRPEYGKVAQTPLLKRSGQLGAIVSTLTQTPVTTEDDVRAIVAPLLGIQPVNGDTTATVNRVNKEILVGFLLKYMRCVLRKFRTSSSSLDLELLVYNYNSGIYVDGNAVVARVLANLLNFVGGDVWGLGLERSIVDLLKRKCRMIPDEAFDTKFFAFRSCALDLTNLKLVPFSPEQLITLKSEVDPLEKPTPIFDHFMATTFDDEEDREFVLEWMGYQFDAGFLGGTVLFMFSTGASGKSSLLGIIRGIIGYQNTTNISLQRLGNDFGLQPLLGKMAVLCDESSAEAFPTDTIKAIATGSPLNVNIKNAAQVEVTLRTKLTFSFNEMPQPEATLGLERRLVVLPFLNFFLEKNANKELAQQLRAELDGIAFKAIGSLKRLRDNDYTFTESKNMRLAKAEYLESGQSLAMRYLIARLNVVPGNRIKRAEVYLDFNDWCKEHGEMPSSNQVFWRDAKKHWQAALRVGYKTTRVQGYDYLVNVDWSDGRAD